MGTVLEIASRVENFIVCNDICFEGLVIARGVFIRPGSPVTRKRAAKSLAMAL